MIFTFIQQFLNQLTSKKTVMTNQQEAFLKLQTAVDKNRSCKLTRDQARDLFIIIAELAKRWGPETDQSVTPQQIAQPITVNHSFTPPEKIELSPEEAAKLAAEQTFRQYDKEEEKKSDQA